MPCSPVANARWNANQFIAASGGVSIDAQAALARDNLLDEASVEVQAMRDTVVGGAVEPEAWWWD